MLPITTKNPNLYKGPGSSTEFNQLRNDIQTDLTNLFHIANKHESKIKENMDVILRENFFMQNRIEKLERKLVELQAETTAKELGTDSKMLRSFYHVEGMKDADSKKPVNVDIVRGIVSPVPTKRHSKLSYRNDNGEYVLPRSLNVAVIETNDTQPFAENSSERVYYSIDQTGLEKAVDGDKDSFWVRTSAFPENSGVTEVSSIMHIRLPMDIMNNQYINTILLNPYPEYSMTILDVQYKGLGDQWHRMETYPVKKDAKGNEVPVPIEESGKLFFSFPRREMTEIKIMFAQPYWFEHDNKRLFTYGFQDIKVEYREYSTEEAEFVSTYSLEGSTRRFGSVHEPVYSVPEGCPQDIEENVEHKLYYDADLTEEFSFGHEISAPIQKVYIKTILRKVGETVPFLKQMELPYSHKELDE